MLITIIKSASEPKRDPRPEAPAERNAFLSAIGGGSAAVLEAPAIVAGLDDVAVMGDAVEQRG